MLSFFEMTMVISIDQLTTNRPLMTGYNLIDHWSGLVNTYIDRSIANPVTYADPKSKNMTHDIYVSQLHLVHQTQFFIEWVVIDHLSFKSKFYRGQNSSKNTLTTVEIGFAPPQSQESLLFAVTEQLISAFVFTTNPSTFS